MGNERNARLAATRRLCAEERGNRNPSATWNALSIGTTDDTKNTDQEAIDFVNPYYKGIKVLFPAQISVNANGPQLNDRKIDDKKISRNRGGVIFLSSIFLSAAP